MSAIPLRTAAWAAIAFFCYCSATADEPVDSFTVQLQVNDETGQPLEDADVNLVGLYQFSQFFHTAPGSISLTHSGGGRYEATIDERSMLLLHHAEAVLVVQAPGRQPQIQQWPVGRLRCDVPIPYMLKQSSGQAMRVVDSDGRSLQGVVLAPAVWNRTAIPLFENTPKTQPATPDW